MPELDKSVKNVINTNLNEIEISKIFVYINKFTKIPGIIKLTIGEPDFNVADYIKKAAIKSIEDNKSHYSPTNGIPELRNSITNFLNTKYNLKYDADKEVIVTVGVTEALYASLAAIINVGDKVIVPTPSYPLYIPIIRMLGGTPIEVDTSDDDFKITKDKLNKVINEEGEDRVKAILLNFPSNPTGREYSMQDLKDVAEVVKDKNMFVISDEIYSELVYDDEKHISIAELIPGKTILVNGLSKSHAMTGYRIGYAVGPERIMENISKAHTYMVTSVSNPAQYAAAEALSKGMNDPSEMKSVYKERRDFLVKELNDMGYETSMPEGAFYTFSKIPKEFGLTDDQFSDELAEKYKLGVIPGSAFGKGGENHFRISYASSMEDLEEGMNRLKKFTEDHRK